MDSLCRENLDILLNEKLEKMKTLSGDSQERKELLDEIEKLSRIANEDDKIENEKAKLQLESEKMDTENSFKNRYAVVDRAIDFCKAMAAPVVVWGLTFAGNLILQKRSFAFETNNSYTARASREPWGFMKPKI